MLTASGHAALLQPNAIWRTRGANGPADVSLQYTCQQIKISQSTLVLYRTRLEGVLFADVDLHIATVWTMRRQDTAHIR